MPRPTIRAALAQKIERLRDTIPEPRETPAGCTTARSHADLRRRRGAR